MIKLEFNIRRIESAFLVIQLELLLAFEENERRTDIKINGLMFRTNCNEPSPPVSKWFIKNIHPYKNVVRTCLAVVKS